MNLANRPWFSHQTIKPSKFLLTISYNLLAESIHLPSFFCQMLKTSKFAKLLSCQTFPLYSTLLATYGHTGIKWPAINFVQVLVVFHHIHVPCLYCSILFSLIPRLLFSFVWGRKKGLVKLWYTFLCSQIPGLLIIVLNDYRRLLMRQEWCMQSIWMTQQWKVCKWVLKCCREVAKRLIAAVNLDCFSGSYNNEKWEVS